MVFFNSVCISAIEISKYLKKKCNEGCLSSIFIHSMDKVGMVRLVNYLSIVGVESPFFRFSRVLLPPYLLPVYILMPQYILQIKIYLYYFINLLLKIPEWYVTLLTTDTFLFYDYYKLLQLFTLARLKHYLGNKCNTLLECC